MPKRTILVLLVLLFIFTTGGVIFSLRQKKAEYKVETESSIDDLSSSIDVNREKKLWTNRIKTVGGEKAYQELKKEYAGFADGIQHMAAHLFGELLYKQMGIKGITICDSSLSFGCYHSFAVAALREKGIGVLKELDGFCIARFGSRATACQHGIGHGVLEKLGRDRLADALAACWTIQKDPLYGCISGLFMEYNLLTLVGVEKATFQVRKFNDENPYAPCNKIAEKYRPGCYHELAQWWDKIFNKDYQKIGRLCGEVKEEKEREACFLGIGMVAAPSSDYDVSETVKKCQRMPDDEGKYLCLIEASWSMTFNPDRKNFGWQICQNLPAEVKKKCSPNREFK